MTEIRPIREAEAEPFLQLLCDVFALDFNRAYDIFFNEPLFDLNRKWALIEGQELVSILTTSPLHFGWGDAVGIAGVATRKSRQGEGHAARLIERVLRDSQRAGESAALLFARDTRLYDRLGFEALDRVVRATLKVDAEAEPGASMEMVRAMALYDAWAEAHPDRLRRDARRWNYWRWNYRELVTWGEGYLCFEPSAIREMVPGSSSAPLALPAGSEWFGTALVTDQLELTVERVEVELYLMGRGLPPNAIPQMFMTDQF